ncbi:hypothetical protein BWR12_22260 [Citrobacter braakii]|nr:hypothetical protein BWR12_22260 [Citrobacter braakii]
MWLVNNINFLRGFLLSASQHGNKPPSRHEAKSLKRQCHYTLHRLLLTRYPAITGLFFRENSPGVPSVPAR